MQTMLRHMIAILLLPFIAVVIVPYCILSYLGTADTHWENGAIFVWLTRSAGAVFVVIGLSLFTWCVRLFAKVGLGTLAPWDPTRNLVIVGPYRFVRNPMISGVALILIGQALLWGSWILGTWACLFIFGNHIYFVFWEEAGLETQFGEDYRVYKANVPRWLPRLTPW